MARQEEIIAQTIANMKRALLRKADDSESDDSIKRPSNRGNKLKRKSKFVEEGRLDQANDVRSSRRRINYNGYFREVISRNPLRVDHDGDVIDIEDEDLALDLEEFEEDPYSDVNIATLLRPLTVAADLKTHPTLSIPYTSKVLDEMMEHAQEMVFREEEALWRIKILTSEFRGDSAWMPVGQFETENDIALLGPITANPSLAPSDVAEGDVGVAGGWSQWVGNRSVTEEESVNTGITGTDPSESNASVTDAPHDAYEAPFPKDLVNGGSESQPNGHSLEHSEQPLENGQVNGDVRSNIEENDSIISTQEDRPIPSSISGAEGDDLMNGDSKLEHLHADEHVNSQIPEEHMQDANEADHSTKNTKEATNAAEQDGAEENAESEPEEEEEDNAQPAHRMTTRAKAQAATSTAPNSPGNPSSPSASAHYIHPFFIPPITAISSREFGLPPDEADKTRRLLCAYVQKQEEVCRAANRIWDGLLKAKRLRDNVLEWCQAEGHIGEMSDGEDWYDREKWGLETDLKKGEELDEEDTTVTGKKTRHRRTARDA